MKIYIVMSTHENESAYGVLPQCFKKLEKAQVALAVWEDTLVADEQLEDDDESGWEVWIEELELQD